MGRRRPLTKEQLEEIAEAARQAEHRRTGDAVRAMIRGTASDPAPAETPRPLKDPAAKG